jgi:OmpA-OmpF porin, OOP family
MASCDFSFTTKPYIMQRSLLFACILAGLSPIFAQKSLDAGLFLASTHYLGDLAPDLPVLGQSKPAIGLNLRYFSSPKFSMRASLVQGSLAGSDRFTRNQTRDFSFRTRFTELSTQLEWHPFAGPRRSFTYLERNVKEPYFFGGLGFLSSRSKVGVHLEKNKVPQSHQNLIVSFGMGYRREFGKRILFDAELGFRPAMHDYLDGLMTAAPTVRMDWYALAGFHINYLIFAQD